MLLNNSTSLQIMPLYFNRTVVNPFEEELDLPALSVDFRNGRGGKLEVIGQKLVRFSLVVHAFDEPEFARVFFERGWGRISDAFIRNHAFLRQRWAMLSGNLETCVVFDSRDEESSGLVDLPKPVQIVVAFVEGVDAVRNDFDVLLCGLDIGHLPVGHQHIAGQMPGSVMPSISFKSFGWTFLQTRLASFRI